MATLIQSREVNNKRKRKFMEEECVVWCLEGGQEEGVKRARWESLEEGEEVWP
ncbi:hypothetical protein PVK06_003112 [Gossypium arboreum]|uniref:Uncharacterized protein n=1 Tax=Gossypium arboreum TaxID=29729 RepID=A0ABR0R6L4_GOSAR|nr:hypothetical protein PVK06_003112 [Gossypium arboreum]